MRPSPISFAGTKAAKGIAAGRKPQSNARDAVKALIVANEFLEAQVEELRADVSKGYARLPPRKI